MKKIDKSKIAKMDTPCAFYHHDRTYRSKEYGKFLGFQPFYEFWREGGFSRDYYIENQDKETGRFCSPYLADCHGNVVCDGGLNEMYGGIADDCECWYVISLGEALEDKELVELMLDAGEDLSLLKDENHAVYWRPSNEELCAKGCSIEYTHEIH